MCSKPIASIHLGKFVVAAALDNANHSLYVASPAGLIYVVDVADCNADKRSGCHHHVRRVTDKGDPDAIAPLEAMLKSGDLNLGAAPYIQMQIDALKSKTAANHPAGPGNGTAAGAGTSAGANTGNDAGGGTDASAGTSGGQTTSSNGQSGSAAAGSDNTLDALKKLQQQMDEVNALLAKIESQMTSTKKK